MASSIRRPSASWTGTYAARLPSSTAPGVLAGLGEQGRLLEPWLGRLAAAAEATRTLPSGLQHADVTLTNVLVDGGTISGLIDFGDMHHTAAVCDLAVTLTSVLRNTADEQLHGIWELTAATLLGYQRHRLLTPAEVEVLGDLVVARLGLTLAIAARRVVTEVDNVDYIGQYDDRTRVVLADWCADGPEALTDRLHRMAGTRTSTTGEPDLLERRHAAMGGPLAPLFYEQPLEIVRGEGHGCSLPTAPATSTPTTTWRSSGTHTPPSPRPSRDSSPRSTPTAATCTRGSSSLPSGCWQPCPAGLDTCLFTTSGTEANELVWRMATAHTGGNAAVIAEHAYHGSSTWMADLSSNEWPEGYRPAHVATFAAPRSATGGTDRATAVARIAAATDDLTRVGDRPALVLADIGFTSEGILDAPAPFLAGLVDGAHEAGALFLADEVQSGFGRSGPRLWRFATAGITPDFVTLGKPMGAGYPIGAVITRREIADSLARDYEYFSTFAATPVAAAAASAVLDVLETNRLPESALKVGEHLRGRLRALADGTDRIGRGPRGRAARRHRPDRSGRPAGPRFRRLRARRSRGPRGARRADRTDRNGPEGATAAHLARGPCRPIRRCPGRDARGALTRYPALL